MRLASAVVAQALRRRADRDQPVRAHLQIVVERLQRVVIEGGPRCLVASRPDQRLVRVGEARALEIRHRVRLQPDDVVLNPVAEILERRPEPKDVVIRADHPDRAVRLQHAAAFAEPSAGEGVVGGEGVEAVPVVVHAIDARVVRAKEFAAELEIIGGIGKDEVDGPRQHLAKRLHAIALNNMALAIEASIKRLNATHDTP